MKKLAVLQQGGHKTGAETKNQKNAFDSEPGCNFFRLNWANDSGDTTADYVVKEPTRFTEGRQLLYELVTRDYGEYEYYLFLDDDVWFPDNAATKILTHLNEWSPLCAAFPCWFEKQMRWDLFLHDVLDGRSVSGPFCYYIHDECHQLFHNTVVKHLFPLLFHGAGICIRAIEIVMSCVKERKNIFFPDIVLKNTSHRSRGEGHGTKCHVEYNKNIKKHKSLLPFRLPAKRLKKHSIELNKSLAVLSPQKGAVRLSNKMLRKVIDVDHDLWKRRNWITDRFTVEKI